MRLLLSILLTLLAIHYCKAQDFHTSDRYKMVLDNFAPGKYINGGYINVFPENGDTAFIRVMNTEYNKEVFKLPLSHEELDLYESSKVEILSEIPLANIKEVVRLEISYLACCYSEYSYYFLVTTEDKYISLPKFKDVHCDGPEPYQAYKFTAANDASEEKIELVRLCPDQKYDIDSTILLKSYFLDNGTLQLTDQ